MKKIFTLIAIILITLVNAQAPQGFNYQATVRNSAGALIVNQNVYFKFNIMLNSQTSLPVYSETHLAPTDDLGQVDLVVGTGTATIGTFSSINWSNGTYYLGIELNTGTGYVAMGTSQLLSVPYALYANSAGNSQASIPNLASVLAVNNGANNLQIKNLAEPIDLQDAVTKSYSDTQLFTQIDSLHTQIDSLQAQITALINATAAPMQNVTIGTQIWSATNLDVTTYRDGTPIPQVTDPTQWANLTTGAWCYYNNDPANGPIYGKLYNWYAVAGIHDTDPSTPNKVLAPAGWHVPSDTEWTTLTTFLGGVEVAGGKMKATGTSLWQSPNTGATNSSGFTGLPGGNRGNSGTVFFPSGIYAVWWSTTVNSDIYFNIWAYQLENRYNNSIRDIFGKNWGLSVRCIRD
jgi:uncharacterized protein (TIGR02145 family)